MPDDPRAGHVHPGQAIGRSPTEPADDPRSVRTDYTDPATIDVDTVIGNINHAHRMRGHTWTDERSWPNVTVKALADEIELQRLTVRALRREIEAKALRALVDVQPSDEAPYETGRRIARDLAERAGLPVTEPTEADPQAEIERLRDAEQGWVDRSVYYRNIAIEAGADPDCFDNDYDRALARDDTLTCESEAHALDRALKAEAGLDAVEQVLVRRRVIGTLADELRAAIAMAVPVIEPLRALVGGRTAAPTREQAITQFGHPFVLVTTEHNGQTDESVVDTSLPIVDVPPDTELVLVPAALLSQSAAPTSQQFEQALHEAGLSATASELATRVVVALLSRPAAEPPPQSVPSTPLDIYIGSGVAAEPNEEHDGG